MTYEETWKVLGDLVTELRRKGETIPPDVIEDLRSAKTMIQVLKTDPKYIENIPKIETFLGKVEAYLISLAQEQFGSGFIYQWMERLEDARRAVEEEGEVASRFVSGLPKGEHWVRIKISEDTPRKNIERLAKEKKLSHKMQKNGYMLVFGDSESVKSFVKTMAEEFRGAKKSR